MLTTTLTGVVTAAAGSLITVDLGAGQTATVAKLRDVTVAVGDLVHVQSIGRARYVVGSLGAAPADDEPLTVPLPSPQDADWGQWSFGPEDPGSWDGAGWRDDTTDLWQGTWAGRVQTGAAWYGVGPSALPGVLVAAWVTVVAAFGTGSPTMALLQGSARVGAPAVLAAATGPSLDTGPVEWPIPAAWLPQLQAGTAGGIGCYTPGAAPVIALSATGGGMTLTCEWEDS